ncbi:MAG: redoxin domain-containing protein [Chloroflexota bacterium]
MSHQTQSFVVGDLVPDFRLCHTPSQTIHLYQIRARRIVIAFCPAVWEPTTRKQLVGYQQSLHLLYQRNAMLITISTDCVWCQMAFANYHQIAYHLLSDGSPKGAVARSYGVYDEAHDTTRRALFLIQDRHIIWHTIVPYQLNPGLDALLTALDIT